MKLQRIEHFIAVVDSGSIRGAARKLGLTQPALSRSLVQLETELGVQLIQRSVRGISVTSAGNAFLAHARVANTELFKAVEEARRAINDQSGLVSLGISPVGVSLLLPELVAVMQRLRPGIRMHILEMSPNVLLALVRDETVDLAVTQRTHVNLDGGLRFKPLFQIQMRVAVRPGHPLAGRRELGELTKASWLSMIAPGISDDIVSRSFLEAGLAAPTPSIHCSSYFVALDLIIATDIVAVLPPPLLTACIAAGKLVEISLSQPLLPLHVGLYTRADTVPTPGAMAVAKTIVKIAREVCSTGKLRDTHPTLVAAG